MQKQSFLFAVFLIVVTFSARAQHINPNLKGLFPKNGDGHVQRRSLKNLTEQEKTLLMKDTEKSNEGYLAIKVPEQYVDQVTNLNLKNLGLVTSTKGNSESIMGMSYLGTKEEGPNRKAHFFGSQGQAKAMVTLWHFAADNGSLVFFEEFLNQKVDGIDATLSLTYDETSGKCLWKLVMNNESDYYEVVLPDELSNKRPKLPVPRVLAEMEKLVDFAKSVQ